MRYRVSRTSTRSCTVGTGRAPGELGLPEASIPADVPGVLRRTYAAIGLLTRSESRFNPDSPYERPLGTQDCLLEPEELKLKDGLYDFAWENQGNWTCYAQSNQDDPEAMTNAAEPGSTGAIRPIGCKLSDFLITLCLQETVLSGWSRSPDEDQYYQDRASVSLWVGKWVYDDLEYEFRTDPEGEFLYMRYTDFYALREFAGQPRVR